MRQSKAPAFQWYPKQFLGDDKVLLMDWEARGMHFWLCCLSWQQDPRGTLPDDIAVIRRWLQVADDARWRLLEAQLMPAWPSDGQFPGRRVNSGMLRASALQAKYSSSRKKSADKRWHSPNIHASGDATSVREVMREPCESHEEEVESLGVGLGVEPGQTPITMIVRAHPKSEHLNQNEIPYAQVTAVIEAMQSEVAAGMNDRDAAKFIYDRTVAIAGIMRAEGRVNFMKDPQQFFALRQYRIPDEEWKSNDRGKSQQNTIVSNIAAAAAKIKTDER